MNWFYNLKISAKLITSFVLVAIIAGVVGVIGVINIQNISEEDTFLYEKMTVPITQLNNIAVAFNEVRIATRDIVLASTTAELQKQTDIISQLVATVEKNCEEFEKTIVSQEMTEEYNNFLETRKEYRLLRDKLVELAKQEKDSEAVMLLGGDLAKAAEAENNSISRMVEMKVRDAKLKADYNTQTANTATTTMIVIIVIGVILAIILGVFISNIISNPIKKIVVVANKIADGDLDVSIEVKTKDETGALAQAFDKMAENLNDAMANINSSAEQVATGSNQVSMSGQALSQGSTEQASSIEEITASMTQVAAQTKENATNANQANELAVVAKNNAVSGNQQMQEMLKAMTEINESSSNISKIIKVIDEIAFQTNILALNAAVEAARAGQHGKGFAVVAEEVRNLAARSANAAKETTVMIEGSIKKVDMGTKIANETAQALNKIVGDVAKAAEIVGGIAGASNEQATAIAQVNIAIEQVSQVVQTNSATAEESAAANEELSGQAGLLKEIVSKFKLRRTRNTGGMSYDKITPDMMKMIEGMMERKNRLDSISTMERANLEAAPSSSDSRLKINLSDKEFGKY